MRQIIEVTYSGCSITYNEQRGRWDARSDEKNISLSDPQLEPLKVKIDKRLTAVKRTKLKPLFAWKAGVGRWSSDGNMTKVKVTSKDSESRYSNSVQYWISIPSESGGRPERMKVDVRDLYAVGGENDQLVDQIKTAWDSIEILKANIGEMTDKLEPFSDKSWGEAADD